MKVFQVGWRLAAWVCFVSLTLLTPIGLTGCGADSAGVLNAVFQDHVVFQRNAPINVWGTADPGSTVTVALSGETIETGADSSGRWVTQLPALDAGGPYTLTVQTSTGDTQSISDVLVGDVFLCSGQSNMALPVSRTLDAPDEIARAADDRVRMLTVERASRPQPRDAFVRPVTWEVASPETVADWSATCYYFARALQQHVDIPIGLIHSSWGGSDIRTWLSPSTLTRLDGYDERVSLLPLYAADKPAAQQAFGKQWEAWWRTKAGAVAYEAPWTPQTNIPWLSHPDSLLDFSGMVWMRATVTLTAAQADQPATLSLGTIDEIDQTWINGRAIGNTFGGAPRTYEVPAHALHAGENVVVVNTLSQHGKAALMSNPHERVLVMPSGERIPLEAWQYHMVEADVGSPPYAPWQSVRGLSMLHNAMIAPLRNYSLKAALWYQGETNASDPHRYQEFLRALIGQWRDQFDDPRLPVLVVQLANYGPPPTTPVESGWAEVREAQRRATEADDHAALVVTVDIGSVYDIHPPNKQEIGRRLARAARHVIYQEDIAPSGPMPTRAVRRGNTIVVAFDEVTGTLATYSSASPVGFELCGPEPGSCRYTEAQLDSTRVLLPVDVQPQRTVTRVRYCWANSPICTLYDASGLPASPFELAVTD